MTAIASSGKTGEGECDRVGESGVVFEREAQVGEAVVVGDRLSRGEAIAIEQQMHALVAGEDVETLAQAVVRYDLGAAAVLRDSSAVGVASEDGIVNDNGGSVAKSSAEAEFDLARVPPRTSAHLLIAQPGAAPGSWLEAAAGAAVVVLAGIPVAVVRLGRAGVDERVTSSEQDG